MKEYKKIIGREVDDENRTIYVIENLEGTEERVLYSEIDQSKLAKESRVNGEIHYGIVIKKSSGDKLVLNSHDDDGSIIPEEFINIEKEKFINPEKYSEEVI